MTNREVDVRAQDEIATGSVRVVREVYESLRDDAKVTNYYADEILKNAGLAK